MKRRTKDERPTTDAAPRDLPDGWAMARLGDSCLKTPLVNPEKRPDKPFRYVDVSSVSNESFRIVEAKTLLGKNAPSRARKAIQTSDVIFATVRPTLKRIAMIPPELDGEVCSTGFCVLRADKIELESSFLYFHLLTEPIAAQVENLQKGATYPAINDSDLLDLSIPLPPLPEQRAIAHALRTVQHARAARKRELTLERERKAALMEHLFTRGTRGEPRKQTEIGGMPESWAVTTIGEICECLDHKRVPVKQSDRRIGDIPYYGASGQTGWIDDYLFDEPLLLIAEDGENLESRKLPIAYSITGKSWVNNHAHVLRIKKANQFFVEYYINRIDISPYLAGATRPKLNKAQLMTLPVPQPRQPEQDEIAKSLRACDAKIAALEREAQVLDELFRAMLDELMTGRRRMKAEG
jgi:type I restriction enzyme S subunit